MTDQKHLFQLPPDIHYLNAAYMSPLLKSVEDAGIKGMRLKRNPSEIKAKDFFEEAERVKAIFSKLINCKPQQVAIIPSVSYGLISAIKNIPADNGNTALIVSDEFPSDYYSLKRWCSEHGKHLQTVSVPATTKKRGESWNSLLLESINEDTSVVVISSVQWSDGTIFNLKKIGEKCRQNNTSFIVDGTQSVGAMPMDATGFCIDALVCAGYKWLLGPYSIGLAYYSEKFNNGIPVEESWMNKTNAENFSNLTSYVDNYTSGAWRYNVGEYSNFILLPMLSNGMEQILSWGDRAVSDYSEMISAPLLDFLRNNHFWVEEDEYRAKHLFGFFLPEGYNQDLLFKKLHQEKIYISLRGKAIRVSPHLYNTKEDIQALIDVLASFK